jgi:hypothetical protein
MGGLTHKEVYELRTNAAISVLINMPSDAGAVELSTLQDMVEVQAVLLFSQLNIDARLVDRYSAIPRTTLVPILINLGVNIPPYASMDALINIASPKPHPSE